MPVQEAMSEIPIGKADLLRQGRDVAILAFGSMVEFRPSAAAEALDATLVNMRFVKPLDAGLIESPGTSPMPYW